MSFSYPRLHCILPTAIGLILMANLNLSAENWPTWRGDLAGSGHSQENQLPTTWGQQKNVSWRIDLPDRGNSTPVIWKDRIFVSQAIEEENFRGLLCFDKKDGSLLWKKGTTYSQKEKTHKANPYCSASPTTDGERVIVSYGSAGLYCYDLDGKQLWQRDFGPLTHIWGNAASPLIYGDLCIFYHGPDKTNGQLTALNKKTGETLWQYQEPQWQPIKRTDGFKGRDKGGVIGSWSTPILISTKSGDQLVMAFPTQVKAFAPKTGEELWTCDGLNPLIYTSPIFSQGTLVAMGGYYGNTVAVKTEGKGDVTQSQRQWLKVRDHGGIGTGVIKDGHIYSQDGDGKLYCTNLQNGELQWQQKLPGKARTWGSLLLSGDHIYTLSQAGESVIFKAKPTAYQQIAHNQINEKTNSSIAVSNGNLFIRTWKGLWCIGE
ncbi:MAG: PQQ-binding-like beta-propeller repeat protein [Verrucomicrobiales bacterium]|nr:PQQ-binding-like beta-propeller repeat protein [Verrucomicrobiales bacterium]